VLGSGALQLLQTLPSPRAKELFQRARRLPTKGYPVKAAAFTVEYRKMMHIPPAAKVAIPRGWRQDEEE